jgi:hypothetical protein
MIVDVLPVNYFEAMAIVRVIGEVKKCGSQKKEGAARGTAPDR